MGRLRSTEFMPYAPTLRGTERVNHEDCPAGTDIKRRLYVTRKEEGNVVAYCHNCGNSGVSGGASRFRLAHLPPISATSKRERLEMIGDLVKSPTTWPKEMRLWLKECGIDLTIATKYGIVYDSVDRRIIIPTRDESGDLVMYQSRRLYGDGTPKYLTYKEKGAYYHHALMGKGKNNTCIIVEDMVSAIRCAEAGYAAVPLFTSTMADDIYLTLMGKYDTIVVWLDNDNATVIRHSREIRKRAALTGVAPNVLRVGQRSDPKHYSEKGIIHIIEEVML